MYLCACYSYVYHVPAATLRGQKRALNAFQQQLQVESCLTWVPGTEPSPLQELHLLLTIEPPFQLHIYLNMHTHERERAWKRERACFAHVHLPAPLLCSHLVSFSQKAFFVLSLKNICVPSMREDRGLGLLQSSLLYLTWWSSYIYFSADSSPIVLYS